MDEISPIKMIVFTLLPPSYRLDLAIVHNYYSICCCEHNAKNGLISPSGSITPDTAHLILVSRRAAAFIMLLTILSSIDDKAGEAPRAVGGNEVPFLYICTPFVKAFQP